MRKKHKLCPVRIISRATNLYQSHWKEFSLILLLYVIIFSLSRIGVHVDPTTHEIVNTGFGSVMGVLSWLATIYLSLAFIRYTLKLIRGEREKLDNLFTEVKSFKEYFFFLLGKVLTDIISLLSIGFLVILPLFLVAFHKALLILPFIGLIVSVYITLSFFLVPFLIADRGMGAFESLEQSWREMRGKRCKIFLLGIFLTLLNVLGVLALFFGIFITIPITAVAWVVAYEEIRTLTSSQQS